MREPAYAVIRKASSDFRQAGHPSVVALIWCPDVDVAGDRAGCLMAELATLNGGQFGVIPIFLEDDDELELVEGLQFNVKFVNREGLWYFGWARHRGPFPELQADASCVQSVCLELAG